MPGILEKMPDRNARRSRAGLRRRELLLATGLSIVWRAGAFARPAEPRRLTLKNMHTGETFNGPYRDLMLYPYLKAPTCQI